MKTIAIDLNTLFYALNKLERHFLGENRSWSTNGQTQTIVFELYRRCKGLIGSLKNLKAKASTNWIELNQFLTENGFDAMFKEPLEGIGAVSILDMLVEWIKPAVLCTIYGGDQKMHVGFEIPEAGRNAFLINGQKVVQLKTKSGDSLWLMMPEEQPKDVMDLIRIAFTTMHEKRIPDASVSTIQVPEIDFDIKPDINFLVGAFTLDSKDDRWEITKAFQQFKLRINKKGARVKVATGIEMRKSLSMDEPEPLVFDKPFIGWFTQGEIPLPIAIFFADFDSWKESEELNLR